MSYNKYSKEMKEKIKSRILNGDESIPDISKDTGVGLNTLYRWRDEAKHSGLSSTTKYQQADKWKSEDKFQVVVETLNLSEIEFSEYCRKKGLYPEQVREWKATCMSANETTDKEDTVIKKELQRERKAKQKTEKELARKEKALAEAAALLVLQKKANAIWGTDEEDE